MNFLKNLLNKIVAFFKKEGKDVAQDALDAVKEPLCLMVDKIFTEIDKAIDSDKINSNVKEKIMVEVGKLKVPTVAQISLVLLVNQIDIKGPTDKVEANIKAEAERLKKRIRSARVQL
jgi:hypothetical protein